MIKRKWIGVVAALTLSMMSAIPALAVTETYSWKFYTTTGNLSTNSGYKNDDEQSYYLTTNSGTISSTNIFGARIRRAVDNAAMSPYKLHTAYETSEDYAYSSSVDTSTLYYMRGKKDDTSTTTSSLSVGGRVTY